MPTNHIHMCFQHVLTYNGTDYNIEWRIHFNISIPATANDNLQRSIALPAAIPHPTATKKTFSQKNLDHIFIHLLHFPAPLPRLTHSFFHKVITGPWHRGKSPHPDRVLMQPAAAVHHHAHGADRPGLSRQGGPKHGICLVEHVVEKALATLTSNMITMETPLICTIQTWEDPGWGVKFGLVCV